MKEYVIAASQIKAGYRRIDRYRNETVDRVTGDTTYSAWTTDDSSRIDSSSNRIKREFSSSRTLVGGSQRYETYKVQQIIDWYMLCMNFDISDVPVNRIQSVAIRAKLTGKNEYTPRGYLIASAAENKPFINVTSLGNCDLGTPETMPYTHDTVLNGLSETGWYLLYNEGTYNSLELLAFSMSNFYLVITTDEASGSTYTITYNKGTYGTGSNTIDTKTEDVAIHLLGAIFTRDGYTQTGWSVNADGSTKDYDLSENYSANANITLYPYWTQGHVATGNVLFIMTENGLQAII